MSSSKKISPDDKKFSSLRKPKASSSKSILKPSPVPEDNFAVASDMDQRSDINSSDSAKNGFNEAYSALRKSFSAEHLEVDQKKSKTQLTKIEKFKKFFKVSDRKGSIKCSSSSEKSPKTIPSKSRSKSSGSAVETPPPPAKNNPYSSISHRPSSSPSPVFGITTNKELPSKESSSTGSPPPSVVSDTYDDLNDIDDSTALNTLYNLFNELVELNRQNRKKAESLVVRFNLLRECFNDLEYKMSSEPNPLKKSSSLDQSDQTTLKDRTDVVSLMFLDENGNDMSSNLGNIVKLFHESENSIIEQTQRCKSLGIIRPDSPMPTTANSKPQAIYGYLKPQTKSEFHFIPSLSSHPSQTDVESTTTPSFVSKPPALSLSKDNFISTQNYPIPADDISSSRVNNQDIAYTADSFSHLKDSITHLPDPRQEILDTTE
ncbi:hypothetical protein BB560_000344 [Smittium megazygosporum]|uniref:Uncharacterized protein n=1 Tax=Smittium megazygosporum TaxID=133381 RepID=A0A2T9ZKU1_9FUNG|nr:hypothetical protein BB560_000344 [Smittium megazygosporum]